MSEKVKMDGKTYELVETNEAGTLMTIKEDKWFGKEIKVPTAKIDSIEKDSNIGGAIAVIAGVGLFITTGIIA
jgi:hypothetical protein